MSLGPPWKHENPFVPGTTVRSDAMNVKLSGIAVSIAEIYNYVGSSVLEFPDSYKGTTKLPESDLSNRLLLINSNLELVGYDKTIFDQDILSAATSANNSEASAKRSEAAALAAEASETNASNSASASSNSALAANDSEAEATAQANIAKQYGQDSYADGGKADLSGGSFPAIPPTATMWYIDVGGQINGESYVKGETLAYSKTGDIFFKLKSISGAVWGGISGDIDNQTDLKNKLATKLGIAGGTLTDDLSISKDGDKSLSFRDAAGNAKASLDYSAADGSLRVQVYDDQGAVAHNIILRKNGSHYLSGSLDVADNIKASQLIGKRGLTEGGELVLESSPGFEATSGNYTIDVAGGGPRLYCNGIHTQTWYVFNGGAGKLNMDLAGSMTVHGLGAFDSMTVGGGAVSQDVAPHYSWSASTTTLTRKSQHTVWTSLQASHTVNIDVSTYKVGDEIELNNAADACVLTTVNTQNGSMRLPDGRTVSTFPMEGRVTVKFRVLDAGTVVVVSVTG